MISDHGKVNSFRTSIEMLDDIFRQELSKIFRDTQRSESCIIKWVNLLLEMATNP